MPSQPRTQAHRPLEPLAEAPPPRRMIEREYEYEPEPRAERAPRRSIAPFVLLFVVLAILVGGALYLSSTTGGPTTTNFGGDVQQTIDDLRDLIRSNLK